jgi:hypothetical protein
MTAERLSDERYWSALRHGLFGASKLVWAAERVGLRLPGNRLSSPYVACVARAPQRSDGR